MAMDNHRVDWDTPDKIEKVYFRGATTGILSSQRLNMLWISE